MNEQDIEQLTEAWIKDWEERGAGTPRSEVSSWLFDTLSPACECDPEVLWQFVRTTYKRELSDRLFATLAAGPLEDLLSYHGPQFIDRIETEARQNPRFAELLGGVWRSDITDDVWVRVEKFRGPTW